MADVNGVNYALDSVPSNINTGKIHVIYDTYEASSSAAGTDIIIGKLTGAARIHDVVIFNDALGGSTTLGVSLRDDAGAETVVKAAAASTSAGVQRLITADIANIPSAAIVGGAEVIVKIAGGTATGTIKAQIFYSVE